MIDWMIDWLSQWVSACLFKEYVITLFFPNALHTSNLTKISPMSNVHSIDSIQTLHLSSFF